MRLEGTFTALATPFTEDGRVDEGALRRLVHYQLDGGVSGLVACGTTAETPTLSHDERVRVVRTIIGEASGRCPVIVGAGGNDTSRVCEEAVVMAGLGADALLSVSPYYNRPSQDGLLRHFEAVADATECPIILYNVPGRTGGSIHPATAARLAEHERIIGFKEASGRIATFDALLETAPTGFSVLSGDDALTFPAMSLGARGVISVASNLVPFHMRRLTDAMLAGDLETARTVHRMLRRLMRACFLDTNPTPLKAGLHHLGLATNTVRLPLVPVSDEVRHEMARALDELGVTAVDTPSPQTTRKVVA